MTKQQLGVKQPLGVFVKPMTKEEESNLEDFPRRIKFLFTELEGIAHGLDNLVERSARQCRMLHTINQCRKEVNQVISYVLENENSEDLKGEER